MNKEIQHLVRVVAEQKVDGVRLNEKYKALKKKYKERKTKNNYTRENLFPNTRLINEKSNLYVETHILYMGI